MDIIEKIVSKISLIILKKIANDKLPEDKRDEFIQRYHKINYSKFVISSNNISIQKYTRYKRINSCIIIQKYYRRYMVVRLKNKNKLILINR